MARRSGSGCVMVALAAACALYGLLPVDDAAFAGAGLVDASSR
eukprot:CAMPEP_0117564688 /NCGR_PEP_ID=MMETSP0784-20121206/56169_1 /TAXON_ID=39447 /ORGANISM="" /LENGTH=42 /DNA_ID= /DNA_START= /DNA_END= /DNA_ORIENTATION=